MLVLGTFLVCLETLDVMLLPGQVSEELSSYVWRIFV